VRWSQSGDRSLVELYYFIVTKHEGLAKARKQFIDGIFTSTHISPLQLAVALLVSRLLPIFANSSLNMFQQALNSKNSAKMMIANARH
jgi:hypothetical protein